MTRTAVALAVCVGIVNVALNLLVRRAAKFEYASSAAIAFFCACLAVGCLSLFFMFLFYSSEESLARGLVLMGAVSILGGSLLSWFIMRQQLSLVELLMLAVLAFLFVYRWIAAG